MTTVDGQVADGFESVRDVFEANFTDRGDLGAACSVYLHGRPVVDIWGGSADLPAGRPWEEKTAVPVFSATKGALAASVNLLIQRGVLDPNAPVSRYWPEFAANGKENILLRWVLSHRAGVPTIDADVTLDDISGWHRVVAAVAVQTPSWPPGAAHGYHPRSVGWILGEVIRRVTGVTPGRFFTREIARPLDLEWWIGLPAEIDSRVARLSPAPAEDIASGVGGNGDHSMRDRALSGPSNLFAFDERWNSPAYLRPEMPSSNGVATARAIARMYAATIAEVDGFRLLDPATVRSASTIEADGKDLILGRRSTFGLGFAVYPSLGRSCPRGTFGHAGAGGTLGFADPTTGLSFGYVTNQLRLGESETQRADALVTALYSAVGPLAISPRWANSESLVSPEVSVVE